MFTGPVKTFAVGYQEQAFSELSYAAHVARSIGTEHHEVVVGMDDFFNALPRLIWHEDEPITWPSSVSLYFVSRLAAEQVKVVLTGEGSDEMFAGYARYRFYALNQRWLRFYRLVPGPLRRAIRSRVASSQAADTPTCGASCSIPFVGRGEDLESLYLDNFYAAFPAAEQTRLFAAARRRIALSKFPAVLGCAAAGLPLLERMLYADQKTYLVELLMKQDQMSMAGLHRKPRPLPGSPLRGIRRARSRSAEAPRRRRQIHPEEGG